MTDNFSQNSRHIHRFTEFAIHFSNLCVAKISYYHIFYVKTTDETFDKTETQTLLYFISKKVFKKYKVYFRILPHDVLYRVKGLWCFCVMKQTIQIKTRKDMNAPVLGSPALDEAHSDCAHSG